MEGNMTLPSTNMVRCTLIQGDDETNKANIEYENDNNAMKVENTMKIILDHPDGSINNKIGNAMNFKIEMKTKAVQCTEYGKTLGCNRNLKVHMRVIHDKIRDFFCDACPKAFSTKSLLGQHQQGVHSTVRKFKCLVCGMGCLTKGELVTHMKCHTGERPFICDACSATFITNSCLKAHKRKHDGTMLTCTFDNCEKEFNTGAHRNSHIKFFHMKASSLERSKGRTELRRRRGVLPRKDSGRKVEEKPKIPRVIDTVEQKTCAECGRVFRKPALLRSHMGRHALEKGEVNMLDYYHQSPESCLITCNICKKEFSTIHNLKEHVINNHIIGEIKKMKQTLALSLNMTMKAQRVKLPPQN